MSLLNSSDREHLSSALPEYSDERGNLYLRLDKQRICQGKVSLSETDAIRIRFKPVKRYRPSGNLESYRGLLSSTE
jgi:RNA binding exosome subunit